MDGEERVGREERIDELEFLLEACADPWRACLWAEVTALAGEDELVSIFVQQAAESLQETAARVRN